MKKVAGLACKPTLFFMVMLREIIFPFSYLEIKRYTPAIYFRTIQAVYKYLIILYQTIRKISSGFSIFRDFFMLCLSDRPKNCILLKTFTKNFPDFLGYPLFFFGEFCYNVCI